MNNYINELKLKDTKTQAITTLHFSPGVNIIIGSKGGGKSTLLKLLHSMHSDYKPEEGIRKMLDKNGISIEELVYYNKEKKVFESLSKYNSAIINGSDLISQDDRIKTKIDQFDEVKKAQDDFLNNLIANNVGYIYNFFNQYINTFEDISAACTNDKINWGSLADLNTKKTDFAINLIAKMQKEIDQTKNIYNFAHELYLDELKMIKYIVSYDNLAKKNESISDELKSDLKKWFNIDLDVDTSNSKLFDSLMKKHFANANKIYLRLKVVDFYKKYRNDFQQKIALRSDGDKIASLFVQNTKKLFVDIADLLAKNYVYFNNIFGNDFKIYLKASQPTDYGITIKIDSEIKLIDDEFNEFDKNDKIQNILKDVLYSPSNEKTKWANWLRKAYTSEMPIKPKGKLEETLINNLSSRAIKEITLDADGQNYATMSLGTRTSFGIKQRIKNNKSGFMFLDQPEDNLDNYTIFNELIPLINENQKINQVFMVTHNSNFGTLTNPKTITTCNLQSNNLTNAYAQTDNLHQKIVNDYFKVNDTPVLHYLEGGEQSLEKRHLKLISKKEA